MYTIDLRFFEEGMVRAVEIEVFEQSKEYSSPVQLDHNYSYDVLYEAHNKKTLSLSSWGFQPLSLLKYQMASYVFSKAYIEDSAFFRNFNREYYQEVENDNTIKYTEYKLKSIFKLVKPIIENIDFDTWCSNQHVMSPEKKVDGDFLYTRYSGTGNLTFVYFNKSNGHERYNSNAAVYWSIYDYNNKLMNEGKSFTDNYGLVSVDLKLPKDYDGKLKVLAKAQSSTGVVTDTSFFQSENYSVNSNSGGIFGLITDRNDGLVTITNLNKPGESTSVELRNGIFSFPLYEKQKGSFRISYTSTDNLKASKVITKDACHYFVKLSLVNANKNL